MSPARGLVAGPIPVSEHAVDVVIDVDRRFEPGARRMPSDHMRQLLHRLAIEAAVKVHGDPVDDDVGLEVRPAVKRTVPDLPARSATLEVRSMGRGLGDLKPAVPRTKPPAAAPHAESLNPTSEHLSLPRLRATAAAGGARRARSRARCSRCRSASCTDRRRWGCTRWARP